MSPRLASAILSLFSGVVVAILVYVFYASPLRMRVENKLFDIRTRLSPSLVDADAVALVTIDEATIAAIGTKPANSKGVKDLSYSDMERVVRAVLKTNASAVAVLLPPQIFPYGDPGLGSMAALAAAEPRLKLATFGLTAKDDLPAALRLPDGRPASFVVKGDIKKAFRRDIVREFVMHEVGELRYLPVALAAPLQDNILSRLARREGPTGAVEHFLRLNYFNTDGLRQVPAERLVANPPAAGLDGKIVLVGYTAFRPWTVHDAEATFVNSPWQVDGEDLSADDGMPVVLVQAVALANLIDGAWLTNAPLWATLFQTLLITAATLAIWRLSVGFAAFSFIGGWSVILIVHAGLFAFAGLYVPLADAILLSSMAMLLGALVALRLEGKERAMHEARASSEAELAGMQDRFLNRFAFELTKINREVKSLLDRQSVRLQADSSLGGNPATKTLVKALGSSEELADYLHGIEQFAMLRGKELRRPQLVRVDVMPVVHMVAKLFDARRQEARLDLAIHGPTELYCMGERTLIGQVLYNLYSNAIKYSPAGGSVRVDVSVTNGQVVIAVQDSGPGIAPEFQERVFEKFYRIKDDNVYRIKGHGLGLYLSAYFAKLIDARITLSSAPGAGARFALELRPA